METRVERGQASEDRVTGAIERQTSMAPSSLFLGLALGSMAVCRPQILGQGQLGALRGPVGRAVSHYGNLQQNGETARIGCERATSKRHRILLRMETIGQSRATNLCSAKIL